MNRTKKNPDAGNAGASREIPNSSNNRKFSPNAHAPQAILIGEFPANARETARVVLENYKGHDLVCIRKWYRGEDGELRPGKDGIAVNVRRLPRLAELVAEALAIAQNLGLLPSEEGTQ
jgi:hypothetical protein